MVKDLNNKITEDEINRVKTCIESYLSMRGININKPFRCLNPNHEDKHPSMNYNPKEYYVHCFSCGKTYDLFDLVAMDKGLDKSTAFIETIKIYEPRLLERNQKVSENLQNKVDSFEQDYKKWQEELSKSEKALSYLYNRGLSDETIKKFGLGFNANYYTNVSPIQAIIIPNGNESFTARNIEWKQTDDKDFRIRKKGKSKIYNLENAIQSDENYCFIAEGEFDCLSFAELGYNAIGLGSCSNYEQLFNANLNSSKTYILALDNDEAGIETTEKITNGFKERNIKYLTFNYGGVIKDPNEALTTDKTAFNKQIQGVLDNMQELLNEQENQDLIEYNQTSSLAKMSLFDKFVEETKNFTPYATGFKKLDECLNGGFYPGLICLGAPSSTGKTTLTLQMADNMAKNGKDVLFLSLEMSEFELMAKSLSRISYEKNRDEYNSKSMSEILYGINYKDYNERELEIINNAKQDYMQFADNLFIKECQAINVNDIERIIKRHIEIRKKKPIVFIDYLQILAPVEKNSDIKQIIDYNISQLKRIARDCFIPIFIISSVNRQSYDEKMEMTSFKSSGGIEFGADVLLGLQFTNANKNKKEFNLEEEKSRPVREISLDIIKQRNGETCKRVNYQYKPKYNYYMERNEDNLRARNFTGF